MLKPCGAVHAAQDTPNFNCRLNPAYASIFADVLPASALAEVRGAVAAAWPEAAGAPGAGAAAARQQPTQRAQEAPSVWGRLWGH